MKSPPPIPAPPSREPLPAAERRWPVAPLLALLVVLLAEVLFRAEPVQSIFWQSVRARSGTQHLAREISRLRMEMANRAPHPRPGLVILGSSQLVYGIDIPELAAQTGLPVYRRTVEGLFPAELVASQAGSDFHPDNRLVLMLSGFDLGARRDLNPDAIRPLATVPGMRNLIAAADAPFLRRHWRSMVDLLVAARCDLWRSRDYARFLLEHPFAAAVSAPQPADAATLAEQRKAYRLLGGNPQMVAFSQRALERFFAEMSGKCREIVVFEGRVSPAYRSANLEALSKETKDFLLRQQHLGLIRYVPIEEQALDLPEHLWRDNTHVTAIGREQLTAMFARVLSSPPPSTAPDTP